MYFDVKGKQVFASTGGKSFNDSKPAIVFLHGSGFDHNVWDLRSLFPAFRDYAVLAPDLPGHTNSAGPPLESIESMADWLNDVIETLRARTLSVVAHSQGCLIALEYAARYPDKLRSVTFIASGLATPVNDDLLTAAEGDPEAAVAMMLSWGFSPAAQLHRGPIPGDSMLAAVRKMMYRNTSEALATDLKACNAYANGKQAAAKVGVATQVIVAGKDRMARGKATTELIEHLNDPEVAVIQESGHFVLQEVPDQCGALLKGFILSQNPTT